MPQTADYPSLSVVDNDDLLFVTDTSDTTDKEDGSTKVATREALFGGPRVPSASELSNTSALQAYIDESLAATGECRLPSGVITIDGTISLGRLQGGYLYGGGASRIPTYDTGNGYNQPAQADRFSTTIKSTSDSVPVFEFDGTRGFDMARLSIETDYIGIHYRTSVNGYPSNHLLMDRVGFLSATSTSENPLAFQAGSSSGESNAADVEFRGCYFWRSSGLRVKHIQGVNFVFSGLNWFGYSKNAIYLEQGGVVTAQHLAGFGVKTWFRSVGGGSNTQPSLINYIYSDRLSTDRPAVFVDISAADLGSHKVGVLAGKVTRHSGDSTNFANHPYYLLPDSPAASQAITVPDTNLAFYTDGSITTPTVAANPHDA